MKVAIVLALALVFCVTAEVSATCGEQVCSRIYEPVCAGSAEAGYTTYGNACEAQCAGFAVEAYTEGQCAK